MKNMTSLTFYIDCKEEEIVATPTAWEYWNLTERDVNRNRPGSYGTRNDIFIRV
jgi:hypothetical protein